MSGTPVPLAREDAAELLNQPEACGDTGDLRSEALALSERLTDLSDAFAAGEVTRAQLASAAEKMRARQAEIETELSRVAVRRPLVAVVGARDVRAAWDALDLSRQRAIVDTLLTVTIPPAKRGPGFDPDTVEITWKT